MPFQSGGEKNETLRRAAFRLSEGVTPPRDLGELFLGFLSIGARSFGGVLPWAYQAMVEERRWLTHADFTETIGLCQVLPGPNLGNASIVLGSAGSACAAPSSPSSACSRCRMSGSWVSRCSMPILLPTR